MRSLFLLILLVNAVYFLWAKSQARFWEVEPPAMVSSPPADSQLPRLRLLAELPAGERQQLDELEVDSAPGKSGIADSRCWIVGPMPEVVTAKQVMLRFHKLNLPARLVEAEIEDGTIHRVYLGPFASEDEALAQLGNVHAAGLDGFLITSGSLAGGISLGEYKESSLASSAIEALSAHGFQAQYQEIPNLIAQQWVVVTLQESSGLVDSSFWVQLDRDFNRLDRKQTWCGAIASSGQME